MRCPFLREAQVKFCQASPIKKMIVRLPEQTEQERCSTSEYHDCPAARQHLEERPSLTHCPFLHESLVQYCTAASVAKYIPYSEASNSKCGTESHRYCELYLAVAAPLADHGAEPPPPPELYFSPNHLWLDVGKDGVLHVGLDPLAMSLVGPPEQVSFVQERGVGRPGVLLKVQGVDLPFLFPKEMIITGTNTLLRTDPARLHRDPYTRGWLVEGREIPSGGNRTKAPITEGLLSGDRAAEWSVDERNRLAALLQEFALTRGQGQVPLLADGGDAISTLYQHLTRQELLRIHSEFFTPTWN